MKLRRPKRHRESETAQAGDASPIPNRRTSTEWMIGWKIANLLVTPDGTIMFSALNQDGIITPYGIDGVAECTQYPWHDAPEATHHCGFNAFHERVGAEQFWQTALARPKHMYVVDNLVLLRVGLRGRVQEGTYPGGTRWGYKASHQRVADVFVPRRCGIDGCEEQACALGVSSSETTYALPGTQYLRPVCATHATETTLRLTFSELNSRTGIAFAWTAPQD